MNLLRLRRTQGGRGMAIGLSAWLALSFGGCTTNEVSIPDLERPVRAGHLHAG